MLKAFFRERRLRRRKGQRERLQRAYISGRAIMRHPGVLDRNPDCRLHRAIQSAIMRGQVKEAAVMKEERRRARQAAA